MHLLSIYTCPQCGQGKGFGHYADGGQRWLCWASSGVIGGQFPVVLPSTSRIASPSRVHLLGSPWGSAACSGPFCTPNATQNLPRNKQRGQQRFFRQFLIVYSRFYSVPFAFWHSLKPVLPRAPRLSVAVYVVRHRCSIYALRTGTVSV